MGRQRGQGRKRAVEPDRTADRRGRTHEAQYRDDTVYDRRVDDVETIYTGDATEQRRLLEAYDVRYVSSARPNEPATVTCCRPLRA